MNKEEVLNNLFSNFENSLLNKSILVGVAPKSMISAQLIPTLYKENNIQLINLEILIETIKKENLIDSDRELISDTVYDFLRESCELDEELRKIGLSVDQLNQIEVKNLKV
jgi:hypothetical protein